MSASSFESRQSVQARQISGSKVNDTDSRLSVSPEEETRPSRKVSFSDVVITSSQVENPQKVLHEEITVVNGPPAFLDETGHPITVRLADPENMDDRQLLHCSTIGSSSPLPVFIVKLGMMHQATLYETTFVVPHNLGSNELELLRFTSDIPGRLDIPINVGASVDFLSCTPVLPPNHGHEIVLSLSTTKERVVKGAFTLRKIENPAEAVHLILSGTLLGRGQGTPFLRVGIHRVGENPEYEDSDNYTEWPGFGTLNEDEEEGADDTVPSRNQGDKVDTDTYPPPTPE